MGVPFPCVVRRVGIDHRKAPDLRQIIPVEGDQTPGTLYSPTGAMPTKTWRGRKHAVLIYHNLLYLATAHVGALQGWRGGGRGGGSRVVERALSGLLTELTS